MRAGASERLTRVLCCGAAAAHTRGRSADKAADGLFRSSGKVIRKAGWMRAYQLGQDGAEEGGEGRLPNLGEKKGVACLGLAPEGHTTKAPARYTEASFVKELEALGIGRPSTYAQILETLKDRQYVQLQGKALVPSLTAFVVIALLETYFSDFVDTEFTARMEASLDQIAQGLAREQPPIS